MKRFLLLFLMVLMLIPAVFAEPADNSEPVKILDKTLNVAYAYKRDLYYRFIFSDMKGGRDGSFEDIFENANIDWVHMTTMDNGTLKNDKPLYVNWMVDKMTPIEKLTIEMAGPLTGDNNETLDWFVSVDGKNTIGGKNGYGAANAATIFERNPGTIIEESTDSAQLSLWTESVKGKKAGDYVGTIILHVYGEI